MPWSAPKRKALIPGFSSGDTDLGVAWTKTMPGGEPYMVVKLDDPTLPKPVFCRLVKTDERAYTLLWQRVDIP